MIKLPELREILRQNKIKGYSQYNKKQLVELLKEKGLLLEESPQPEKTQEKKWDRLKTIRKNPKQVVLKSVKTGDEITFSSIYKASQFIGKSPRIITFWNGRVWNNLYKITIVGVPPTTTTTTQDIITLITNLENKFEDKFNTLYDCMIILENKFEDKFNNLYDGMIMLVQDLI